MGEVRGFARRRAFERDWTKGSIIGNLLSLSWPIIINQSLNMLGPTIDMIWVGKLGAAAIAGVGVSGMVVMLVDSARMGLTVATRAMVARFVGAGDAAGANHVARQILVISGIFALVMALIGIFFAKPILMLFGVEADVADAGVAYMRIMLVGSVAMSFRMMAEGVMQASGDAMTPMKIAIFFRFFHVALCPFLVFGWWLFPSLGVSGAAIANVVSQSLGAALGLWVLFSGRSWLRLTLRNFRLDFNIIWRIVKIGLPASITGIERTLSQLMLMWFMVPFGTLAVAGHSVCQRLDMIMVMIGIGLGNGAGVLVGQNLGARQPERAERSGWLAVGLAEGLMLIWSLTILLWGENVIRLFTPEPGVVELASVFLKIAAAGYLVMSFNVVLQHCISGAGDTLPPMLATLLTMWLVQMPLAFFLPRVTPLGVYGVRWAMAITMLVGAVAFTTYFRMGRWKRKKV